MTFTQSVHNLWFYTHFLVVSERWYITEEDHTYMEEKEVQSCNIYGII